MDKILEKEIKIAKNADRYLVLDKGRLIEEIARHFFELGRNTKKEESYE